MSRQLTVYLAFVQPAWSPKKNQVFLHVHVTIFLINLYVDSIPFKDQYHVTKFFHI